ncbi:MAG: DUF84 family protein [Chloroflexota bacterium]
MIHIAIGTKSQYKFSAVLRVLSELDVDYSYTTFAVDSGVSEQPVNEEVRAGSVTRAMGALAMAPDKSDLGIGVEFGYLRDGQTTKMICYASLATGDGRIYTEHSSSLELPQKMVDALERGVSVHTLVNESIDKVEGRQLSRAYAFVITKRRFIYESCENVLLRYLLNDFLY